MASLVRQADEVATGIVRYLEGLPGAEWTRPSDCAGWRVADLVGHLILVEELLGGSITRGLQGDSGPPPQAAGGLEGWRQWRSSEIARLGGLPPAELLGQFAAGLEPMRRALADLAATDASGKSGWHPMGVQVLSWFPGQWLVELALHDWDMRVATDPNAQVNPAALPGLGPEMRIRMPRCFKPDPGSGRRGIVRISLDGAAPVAWLAHFDPHALEVLDEGATEPAATIRTDPGSYAIVQTRRRPADFFEQRGRWRVDGDSSLADYLAASFTGY
jgi:uncharacterized protein (TIGR03083 family)